jgi:hypothetical protein
MSTLNERITAAMQAADEAYWETIAKAFPECKTGDVAPDWMERHDAVVQGPLLQLVTWWVEGNLPFIEGIVDDPELALRLQQVADEQGITVGQLMQRLEDFRPDEQDVTPEAVDAAKRRLGL